MPTIGNIDLKRRWGRDWIVLILSLLLAFFAWFVHNISKDYTVYMQYRVQVTTNIEGRAPTSVANETLLLRVTTQGISILRSRGGEDGIADLTLNLPGEVFLKDDHSDTRYLLSVSSIRERLSEALGSGFDIESVETTELTFDFPEQTYKRVPVVAQSDISYKEQYMRIGEIDLLPDSVNIYGNIQLLDQVKSVNTKVISLNQVDKSVKGVIQLEPIRDVRIDVERLVYSISVERYVESFKSIKPEVVNLPSDKSVILLPSTISVSYRTPFKARNEDYSNRISFVVDYNDLLRTKSSKVVPKLKEEMGEVLSYHISPNMVECIITDNK